MGENLLDSKTLKQRDVKIGRKIQDSWTIKRSDPCRRSNFQLKRIASQEIEKRGEKIVEEMIHNISQNRRKRTSIEQEPAKCWVQ